MPSILSYVSTETERCRNADRCFEQIVGVGGLGDPAQTEIRRPDASHRPASRYSRFVGIRKTHVTAAAGRSPNHTGLR